MGASVSITVLTDRRGAPRFCPGAGSRLATARIRPGRELQVLNLSTNGMLVDGPLRLLPGSMVDVQLHGTARPTRARVHRSAVSALGPGCLHYRAALTFERPLDHDVLPATVAEYPLPGPDRPQSGTRGSDYSPAAPVAAPAGVPIVFCAKSGPNEAGTAFVLGGSTGAGGRGR